MCSHQRLQLSWLGGDFADKSLLQDSQMFDRGVNARSTCNLVKPSLRLLDVRHIQRQTCKGKEESTISLISGAALRGCTREHLADCWAPLYRAAEDA